MKNDAFSQLLARAQNGENHAMELIIEAYMPLIDRYSYVDGALDEDCRQFLLLRVLLAIRKFKWQ